MKSKKLISILLIIACIISVAFGVVFTVKSNSQKSVYTENAAIVQNYNDKYESEDSPIANNPILNSQLYRERAKEKADDAQILADDALSQSKKYMFICIVLYVAGALMLVSLIVIIKPKKVKKEDE